MPTLRLLFAIAIISITISFRLTSSTLAVEPPVTQIRLSLIEVSQQMQTLPGWTTDGTELHCTYQFQNFVEAIAFVNRLVEPAEAAGHHPDLAISYNKVTIRLTTHDVGGLTQLDFELAQLISQLSAQSE